MNNSLYSEKVIDDFLDDKFFLKDATLKRYFEQNKVNLFRKRYKTLKGDDKDIKVVIYAIITNALRHVIYEIISELTVFLKPMGDLIVSGGEAFNMYFSREYRVVTSDIDTKFVPSFPLNNLFFYRLQATKILLWNKLGQISKKFNKRISNLVPTENKIFKFLGVKLPKNGPYVTRRYILMPKSKIEKPPVLIDVELMALDLKLNYYSLKNEKVKEQTLGGILDIAFMRPNELGYEVFESKENGVIYFDPEKKKLIHNKNILIAGKYFLLEDVYILQMLGLRPDKVDKDKKRMVQFSKDVLGIKNISSRDSLYNIFEKAKKKLPKKKDLIIKRSKFNPEDAKKINVKKYKEFTTDSSKDKLIDTFIIGSNKPLKGFKPTNSNMRFDVKTSKWVKNTNKVYVRNSYLYRRNKNAENIKTLPKIENKRNFLHSYNPQRDFFINQSIVDKAFAIPFIGLKKTNSLYKNAVRPSVNRRKRN